MYLLNMEFRYRLFKSTISIPLHTPVSVKFHQARTMNSEAVFVISLRKITCHSKADASVERLISVLNKIELPAPTLLGCPRDELVRRNGKGIGLRMNVGRKNGKEEMQITAGDPVLARHDLQRW